VADADRLRRSNNVAGVAAVRIGVFGGTFDPPHVGHLVTAVNVRHVLDLDEVLLVVANEPWQKLGSRPITPAIDRLAMVEAAVAEVDGLAACDLEIRRGGHSYTADTLADLAERTPDAELFLVLGADAAAGLPTWERVEDVRSRASLIIVDRPGEPPPAVPEGWDWTPVVVPRLEVSSTDLRDRVVDGRPLDYLLPSAVISCVRERHLYREST
jgi:nicotinate-nucleotide adenylyltransferase